MICRLPNSYLFYFWMSYYNGASKSGNNSILTGAPKFLFSKAPQFWSKAPQFENFPISMKFKIPFLLHFYVTISLRATQKCKIIQSLLLCQDFPSKWLKIYAPQKILGTPEKSQNATLALKRHI